MAVVRIEAHWQNRTWLGLTLLPVAALYRIAVGLRHAAYGHGLLRVQQVGVPVVIVGNITVGGTGKTPLVMWLAQWLVEKGWRPGIVSRGYRGGSTTWPRRVTRDSDPAEVGDEPVLVAQRTALPVCVGPDRVAAARELVEAGVCDVIVSDDGLQHYALARDIEIAVLDGRRRLGNGWCLPSGPLREPPGRLRDVAAVVTNGAARTGEYAMRIRLEDAVSLAHSHQRLALASLRGKSVRALAGVGNPERFFEQLREYGMQVTAHPFPDHHSFTLEDLAIPGDEPILMTEKDAVKCRRFASSRCWAVPASAEPEPALERKLATLIDRLRPGLEQ